MGGYASKLPAQSHFLTNKDCMMAFAYFDKDDTGVMEFAEMQEAFNTMLAPYTADISAWEGQTFTPAKFRQVAEDTHRAMPQYNVAANLMKFIRENAAEGDDGVDLTDPVLKKVFAAYDKDGTGEFSIMEMFKLFQYLGIPLQLLFAHKGLEDGSVDFDEFCSILRKIDADYPSMNIDDRITGVAANLADGAPNLDDQPDPDPENDPADQDEEEPEPPNKKALLVGINYIGSSCELGGCINDVRNQMRVLTEQFGFSEENILLLTEDQDDDAKRPTAEIMRNGITWLTEGASEGDFLFFAYSGHGSQLPCQDGTEPDGKNEILCPLDLQDDWYANSISDNYLFDVFFKQLPDGVRCLCVYDCCHSGTMSDLSCTRDLTPPGEDCDAELHGGRYLEPDQGILDEIATAAEDTQSKGLMRRSAATDLMDADTLAQKLVWTISGCQDCQTSADATIKGVRQGAMSWSLLEALEEGGFKGPWHYKYDSLVSTMRKKLKSKRFAQIPQLATTDQSLFNRYYMSNPP